MRRGRRWDLVTRYYSQAAPDLEITNLLDDGVMRLLDSGELTRAKGRLSNMLRAAGENYQADAAVLTCSAVSPSMLGELRSEAPISVLKIDEPMCDAAVRAGRRIGLLVSFPPTSLTTRALLAEAGGRAGRKVEIVEEQEPGARKAQLAGDEAIYEELLLAAVDRLWQKKPDAIVLAQVSMTRLAPRLTARLGVPVFSSLASSLEAVRVLLRQRC
jgi:Asp/Glu/hydantoin racemase